MKNTFRLRASTHTHTHGQIFRHLFLKFFPVLCFLPLFLSAQVRTTVLDGTDGNSLENYIPYHESTPISDVKLMPPVDVEAAIAEHEAAGREAPLYGVPIPVSLTKADGDTTEKGVMIVWRLNVRSNGAISLNFHLNDLNLPPGSELYIYNQAGTMVSGPVTSAHVYEGQYATDIISGEEVYLEAIVRKSSFEAFEIAVHTVVHGFQDLEVSDRIFGASGACNLDVNCPVGAGFTNERDAVCKIFSGTAELCSGSLISDDCQSLRSFVLTADHCLDNNVANWVFRFNYDSPNPTTPACRGSDATTWLTYSGATLRANNAASDFALVEMSGSIIGQPTLAVTGWDRTATTPTTGTCIHHPSGDVKKISFSTGALTVTANGGGAGTDHIRVVLGLGTMENGSSGSPLLDGAQRIVGQLHSGTPTCPTPTTPFFFGRFFSSWVGGGTNATRLSNWLGINGSGIFPTTTNTMPVPTIGGTNPVCSSFAQSFVLNDLTPGATASWSVTPASLFVTASGSGTTASLQASSSSASGLATLTFTFSASSDCNAASISRQVWVGKPDISVKGDDKLCFRDPGLAELTYNFGDQRIQSVTSVAWTFSGPLSTLLGYADFARYRAGLTAGYGTITVTVTNPCGSTSANFPYQIEDCGGGMAMILSPNPILGKTNVEIIGAETKNMQDCEIFIYDGLGNLVFSQGLQDQAGQIDLGSLKPGLYFVEVLVEGIRLREKILKTH